MDIERMRPSQKRGRYKTTLLFLQEILREGRLPRSRTYGIFSNKTNRDRWFTKQRRFGWVKEITENDHLYYVVTERGRRLEHVLTTYKDILHDLRDVLNEFNEPFVRTESQSHSTPLTAE